MMSMRGGGSGETLEGNNKAPLLARKSRKEAINV
jgi:hypothetical protein